MTRQTSTILGLHLRHGLRASVLTADEQDDVKVNMRGSLRGVVSSLLKDVQYVPDLGGLAGCDEHRIGLRLEKLIIALCLRILQIIFK